LSKGVFTWFDQPACFAIDDQIGLSSFAAGDAGSASLGCFEVDDAKAFSTGSPIWFNAEGTRQQQQTAVPKFLAELLVLNASQEPHPWR
jgi:hypothetical protein